MFQINTGANQQWEVDYRSQDAVTLNSEPFAWDISDLGGGRFHILTKVAPLTPRLLKRTTLPRTLSSN